MTLASASMWIAREEASDARDIHWKQWQGSKRIVVAVVVAAVWIQQKH
jgi:hypothetical protein